MDSALPSGDVPEERFKTSATEERAPEGGMEVAPVTEGVEPRPADDKGAAERVGSKRPPPSEVPAPAPVPKRSQASRRPAPALPPLEKKKETSVVPLLSALDNDILNAEDITHQSPASVVVEILRERMFGGVTEASDPRLLALTGLLATDGPLYGAQEHLKTLRRELAHTKEALEGADKREAAAEARRDEVLEQLSSLEEAQRERDEAQHQHESLKADFDAVLAQKDEALARVVVLEQELSKQSMQIKDLTLPAEESKLQNQQLCQAVKVLENRVQLECEERLREYKESTELKKEIEQACEARLQDYKDSSELKAKIAEACEERLAEFKASDEMKNAIWHKGFCMFISGFNRGLREARYAPSTPLAEL
ncbi:uncharacterized abhydrolase domain-containing protein DDB_G0269086-like [Manihot esculenta]|uniref:uncharacterized abhydrolase domain-containing protein DDB_G0269086-like n=1 Tax=Manihot esculenta TaxID=3983 RepID=UPI000B5D56AE|nr:uncharacterized abhydrolase domain-containing protein DDB_G0269086-like [Manihot esculenta]